MRPKIVWESSRTEQALAEMCIAEFIGVHGHIEYRVNVLTAPSITDTRKTKRRPSIWHDKRVMAFSCPLDEIRRGFRVGKGDCRLVVIVNEGGCDFNYRRCQAGVHKPGVGNHGINV